LIRIHSARKLAMVFTGANVKLIWDGSGKEVEKIKGD